jgi:hypothetical protein
MLSFIAFHVQEDDSEILVIVPCFAHQYRLGLGVRFKVGVRVCVYVYGGIQLTLQHTIISIT